MNKKIIKIVFFTLFIFLAEEKDIKADTLFYTPSLITNIAIPEKSIGENKIEKKDKLSRAEILYGSFENLDSKLLISKENNKIGYLINYERFKIDSFTKNNNIKILNSGFGYDNFNSTLYFLLSNNFLFNLNIDYKSLLSGLMKNKNYNTLSDRNLFFTPRMSFVLTERLRIKSKVSYNNFYKDFESSNNIYTIDGSVINLSFLYSRIWSKINAFNIKINSYQYKINYNNNSIINNIVLLNLKDKFALSKKLIITTGLDMNINRHYSFIIRPLFYLSYSFEFINLNFQYYNKYLPLEYKKIIYQYRYVKIDRKILPVIKDTFLLKVNTLKWQNVLFSFVTEFNSFKNLPLLILDGDLLYRITSLNNADIETGLEFYYQYNNLFSISLEYKYIPYLKYLYYYPKNKLNMNIKLKYYPLYINLTVKYCDIKKFLDYKNDYISLRANINMNIDITYNLDKSMGIKLSLENINWNDNYILPLYNKYEKLYKIGIFTGF